MKAIATIENDFKEKFGIPRQSGSVDGLYSRIVFAPKYRNPDALRGIEGFSHLWLIWEFSEAKRDDWSPTVRPPRLGGNRRMGVFATRSPFRPNPIGLSSVRLIAVEKIADKGHVLIVSGADLLDGTPIYDIKPYIPESDCHADAAGGFADEVSSYALEVDFPQELEASISAERKRTLTEILKQDPRPSYQDDPEREYAMRFADKEIFFRVEAGVLHVLRMEDHVN